MIREFLVPGPLILTGNVSKNWESFKKKFDKFMEDAELNNKPEETKLAIFFQLIGKDAIEVFKTFKFNYQNEDETIPSSMTLENVMDRFKKYCDKKNLVIYNVCKFFERKQLPGEDFDHYLEAIIEIAKFCDFEVMTERMLRNRIVSGVKDVKLREELLLLPNATFDNVVKYCKDFEARDESYEILNEEEIHLFSYKLMKCKELKDNMNHIKSYITVDVKDLVQNINKKQVKKENNFSKENHDTLLCNKGKNEQCVPSNSSDKENNLSTSLLKAEMGETSDLQDVSMEKNEKVHSGVRINPKSELFVKNLVQNEKLKIRWEDIFSACKNNSDSEGFESPESDIGLESEEIFFVNEFFKSKSNHEIIKQEVNNNDEKSKVMYSEILKERLRKRNTSSFKCENCKRGFPQKFEFLLHEKACKRIKREKLEKGSKKKNQKFKVKREKKCKNFCSCKECGKICAAEHYLKLHMSSHTKEKPFKCEICKKSFSLIMHYKNHLRVHKAKR